MDDIKKYEESQKLKNKKKGLFTWLSVGIRFPKKKH